MVLILGLPRQRPADRFIDRLRYLGPTLAYRWRPFLEPGMGRDALGATERRLSAEALVEDAGESVLIATGSRLLAANQLRGQIGRPVCPLCPPELRQIAGGPPETEVDHPHAPWDGPVRPGLEQNVLRFQIAVYDAMRPPSRIQTARHLGHHFECHDQAECPVVPT